MLDDLVKENETLRELLSKKDEEIEELQKLVRMYRELSMKPRSKATGTEP